MIIMLIVYGFVGMIMIGIGITQRKSKNPVGFYSGVEAPKVDEVRDVKAWNKKHGIMWIIYGCCIMISAFGVVLVEDASLILIPALGGITLPLPFMILYHHRLKNIYMKK